LTELTAVATKTLEDILAINKNIEALQKQASDARQAAFEPFLAELAKSGQVSHIVIRGYTPGFNDGEPCEHSADYWVNVRAIVGDDMHEDDAYGFSLPEEVLEGLQDERSWDGGRYVDHPGAVEHNTKLCAEHGLVYGQPSGEIMSAIGTVIFDTIEEENETDYFVSFVLVDGKFERFDGDYECGY
jgi:hypothetical protein